MKGVRYYPMSQPLSPRGSQAAATTAIAVAGPVRRPAAVWTPAQRRVAGLLVALGAAAVLVVAAFLEPSPTGLGTHQQFRMPPCGWIMLMDIPCPTCGWTTAFAHAADGRLLTSFRTQPFGCLLSVGTGMALLVGISVAVTGSRLGWIFTRLWGRGSGWLLGAMILLAWVYKVLSYKGLL